MTVNLGKNIKYIRMSKNITAEEMAKKLQLSVSGYGKYERGDRNPSIDVLIKISQTLDVSIDNLLGLNISKYSIDTWILEIVNANFEKKKAMREIWGTVKDL